jgi:hypothetical protein
MYKFKMTLIFWKLEHMCYLNVQATITTKNAYWLFVTIKSSSRGFFLYSLMVTQFEYEKVIDLGFWKTPYIIFFHE